MSLDIRRLQRVIQISSPATSKKGAQSAAARGHPASSGTGQRHVAAVSSSSSSSRLLLYRCSRRRAIIIVFTGVSLVVPS